MELPYRIPFILRNVVRLCRQGVFDVLEAMQLSDSRQENQFDGSEGMGFD